jgi:magnesium chelatase family protein
LVLAPEGVMTHDLTYRAIEVAAAGGHNVLLVGPKSYDAARRLYDLLPPLSGAERGELEEIYAHVPSWRLSIDRRPFRAPHFTAPEHAMLGRVERERVWPGEVSLAHSGVLYLEDLPDHRASVIDRRAHVLADGQATLWRNNALFYLPARPLLVAHAAPCVCGAAACSCPAERISRHRQRLTRILAHIDIRVEVNSGQALPSPEAARERVARARALQGTRLNARAPFDTLVGQLAHDAPVAHGDRALRALRVARTIADLDGSTTIQSHHVDEARGLTSVWSDLC